MTKGSTLPGMRDREPFLHPAAERLVLVLRSEVPAAERREIVRHLLAGCPACVAVTRSAWAPGPVEIGAGADPPAPRDRSPRLTGARQRARVSVARERAEP